MAFAKGTSLSAKTANMKTNLDNASVLAGFGGLAVGIGITLLNSINSQNNTIPTASDKNKCDKPKMILL